MGHDDSSAAAIIAALRDRAQTVAVAESITGGLISAELTAVPGSSAVFAAGLVVYTAGTKAALADVPHDLIDRAGVVSREVAEALAQGARQRGGADWGVGATGAAGPESHGGRAPGTVCVAVASPDGGSHSRLLVHSGSREEVRRAAVGQACALLERAVRSG